MNKKPTILAVAALGSLALIGTGFAGWVIVANATSTASGNITAYTVADRRLNVTEAKWGSEKSDRGSIIFGKPAHPNPSVTSAWFFGEDVETEKLEDSFVVNVKSGDANDQTDATVSAKIAPTDPDDAAWKKAAIENNYVAAPTITFNGTSDVDLSGDATGSLKLKGTTEVAATFTVKFSWGEYFKVGNEIKNPYDFFNEKEAGKTVSEPGSVTWGEEAKTVMSAIADLDQLEFTVTVTFTHAAA